MIMMDCARPTTACDQKSDNPNQKCGTPFAYPYFISFYIICSFLVREIVPLNSSSHYSHMYHQKRQFRLSLSAKFL